MSHDLKYQQHIISTNAWFTFLQTHVDTHTNTNTHTHVERLPENNCLGSVPAQLHPPLSPGREHRGRGRHAGVGPSRSGRSLKEAGDREGFSGRGSALLEVLDTNGKAFSLPCRVAEWLSFIFLYVSHNRKTMSKKHVARIFPGRGSRNNCNPVPEEEDVLWN